MLLECTYILPYFHYIQKCTRHNYPCLMAEKSRSYAPKEYHTQKTMLFKLDVYLIYICLSQYVFIYISVYLHIYIYLFFYIHINFILIYLSPYTYIYLLIFFLYVYCLYIYHSIQQFYVSIYLCIYLSIYVFIYVSMYLCIYLSIYLSMISP